MITTSDRKLPSSYDNQVQIPDAVSLLIVWLEEDVDSLRSQRDELNTRIQRAEQRLNTLRDTRAFAGVAASAAGDQDVGRTTHTALESPVPDPSLPERLGADLTNVVPKRSIMSLRLETRTHNALTRAGVNSFAQLVAMTPGQLRALPGFGAGCLSDLETALARVQIELPKSLDSNSTSDTVDTILSASTSVSPALADSQRALPAQDSQTQYDEAVALYYKFGVVRPEDLAKGMHITNAAADDSLSADPRWRAADGGWFVRAEFTASWIAKRTFEVLNGVKSVGIEPLYQSLKRIATHKFLEQGCRMPSRDVLIAEVQRLRAEGVRFDDVKEIASVDAAIGERDLSGTAQAIIKAFDNSHRALTGVELMARIQSAGLSDASAQLALGASPLVTKVERGIYSLVGRHADMRDIANARMRRESGKTSGSADA